MRRRAHLPALFGAVAVPGDVIVVVRGPEREMVIHRRERIGGIWIKRNPITFENVPGSCAVEASRHLRENSGAGLLAGRRPRPPESTRINVTNTVTTRRRPQDRGTARGVMPIAQAGSA